ncbi:site-specific integrase [Paraburkholderia terrae]|uniref:Site-specific integrase n=1 Tax=Paraburkholderia terrae TaxID=311230 RepID=A0A2I8F4S9_9BURK|nr:site-specific integrase [Paraburkholderia terrae]AUT66793.1 site-specific integrase [Paraburkholderia terrae]
MHAADRASWYSIHRPSQNEPTTDTRRASPRLQAHRYARRATARVAYPGGAADLRRASSHGLRHTHANHARDAGSDLRDVQTDLGHAGLSTTTHYTKGNDARRYQAVNGFFEDALSAGGT